MTVTDRSSGVVGNPVRREALLRSTRSNASAVIVTVWTVGVAAVAVAVMTHHIGLNAPFKAGDSLPDVVGASLAQWWILTIGVGVLPLAVVLATLGGGATTMADRIRAWSPTLVGSWRTALGLWVAQVSLQALALVLTLPVAGIALALGGTTVRPIGIALLGALGAGATMSALMIALACRARGTATPLIVGLLVAAAITTAPYAVHVARNRPVGDPVMTVLPIVGITDAARPLPAGHGRFGCGPGLASKCWNPDNAAQAPLHGIEATVRPWSAPLTPWAWTGMGALAITVVALGVTSIRIGRSRRR